MLLLDPYAREILGHFNGYGQTCSQDNAATALKARVVDTYYDWGDDTHPCTRWVDTVLYEAHVKGLTKLHPRVPPALRGTYSGLACEAAITHLQRLGVTAVSLLPVHQRLDEQRLVAQGLSNYWGLQHAWILCSRTPLCRLGRRRGATR